MSLLPYLYPLLHEDVEALEDVVAVREALGGLEATLQRCDTIK